MLSAAKVGVLGLWGALDKVALDRVAYNDFMESIKLVLPLLFVPVSVGLEVSLKMLDL